MTTSSTLWSLELLFHKLATISRLTIFLIIHHRSNKYEHDKIRYMNLTTVQFSKTNYWIKLTLIEPYGIRMIKVNSWSWPKTCFWACFCQHCDWKVCAHYSIICITVISHYQLSFLTQEQTMFHIMQVILFSIKSLGQQHHP